MIYEKLAGAFVDEIKDIYLQRVEELSPNIRYCAYNIGDESAVDDLRQMRLKTGAGDPLTSRLDVSRETSKTDEALRWAGDSLMSRLDVRRETSKTDRALRQAGDPLTSRLDVSRETYLRQMRL